MFARDEVVAGLGRLATALKNAGETDQAIQKLRERKPLMVTSPVHFYADEWCRLPLLLQQAGRFDEAMDEFAWLLSDLPRRARREAYLDDPNVSFGKTSKRTIYNNTIKNGTAGIRRSIELAKKREERRKEKAMKDAKRPSKVP